MKFELHSISITASNNKLYWLSGTAGLFARYVAIVPTGNYTFLGLVDRVQTAVTAAAGTMALTVLASANYGRLQFQDSPAFVIKLPTASEVEGGELGHGHRASRGGDPFRVYHAQLL